MAGKASWGTACYGTARQVTAGKAGRVKASCGKSRSGKAGKARLGTVGAEGSARPGRQAIREAVLRSRLFLFNGYLWCSDGGNHIG